MLLTSTSFLFFFLPFSLLINYLNLTKKRKVILLGALSAYFYILDNGYLILILVFLTFIVNIQIKKNYFNNVFFIILLLFPLFIFKYSFLIYNFLNIEIPIFILANFPIGLSFFTFQAIAYYFDVKRKENVEDSFEIFTFLTFFPQLLAGPIVDISTYRKGIRNNYFDINNFNNGINRLSLGLIKKFLIADTLAQITSIYLDSNFEISFSFLSSFLLIFCYTFQIYFDFSAYCDIAIGIGLLFGFRLPENFNRPYLAFSFQDFWRRWHITLSNFFKNFVYIPLGGNRTSKLKNYINLWITFFLTALWHGATLNFILWGLIHGLFLTFEKILGYKKFFSNRLITFILVALSWVPFFSKSVTDTVEIISSLVVFETVNDNFLPVLVQYLNLKFFVVFIVCIISLIKFRNPFNQFKNNFLTNLSLLIISIFVVLTSSVDPFIYFKF